MPLNDFMKIVDTYDEKKLKEMTDMTVRSFRTVFGLIADSKALPRLKTDELHTLRTYIQHKLNLSLESSANSLLSTVRIDMDDDIKDLSKEAEKELRRLENYCLRLRIDTDKNSLLVNELKLFIKDVKERIEEASNPPEILYPTVDRDRCYALSEAINQIKANLSLIIPIFKAQGKITPSSPDLSDRSPTSSPDDTSGDNLDSTAESKWNRRL